MLQYCRAKLIFCQVFCLNKEKRLYLRTDRASWLVINPLGLIEYIVQSGLLIQGDQLIVARHGKVSRALKLKKLDRPTGLV